MGKKVIKSYLKHLWNQAETLNKENILLFLEQINTDDSNLSLLDLGCDDGCWTKTIADQLGAKEVYGVEVVTEQAKKAELQGIKVYQVSLQDTLPFPDNSVDVIHANQVIEHLGEIDLFVAEIYRVLKPGGYAIISTENGSSWHNIFAAIMGWQIFSLTNVSSRIAGLGNPLALHRGVCFTDSWNKFWTHKTIFNYLGLIELFQVHDFTDVKIAGAGYHPLPAIVGRWDITHSHFITIKAKK